MDQRRIYERIAVELPARYQIRDGNSSVVEASVVNMGAEGLCLFSGIPQDTGARMHITVTFDDGEEISLEAEVIWVQFLGNVETYGIGVQIIEMNKEDESKFVRFYLQKISTLKDIEDDE
jgi:hypothetical protein